MAVGRDEIRDLALSQEMEGLNGWIYPYQTWVIDEKTGDMIGLWKQVYEGTREDGTNYALEGIQAEISALPRRTQVYAAGDEGALLAVRDRLKKLGQTFDACEADGGSPMGVEACLGSVYDTQWGWASIGLGELALRADEEEAHEREAAHGSGGPGARNARDGRRGLGAGQGQRAQPLDELRLQDAALLRQPRRQGHPRHELHRQPHPVLVHPDVVDRHHVRVRHPRHRLRLTREPRRRARAADPAGCRSACPPPPPARWPRCARRRRCPCGRRSRRAARRRPW